MFLLLLLPACLGPKSLKGEKIKSFNVKLGNEPTFCPSNPFNIEVVAKLESGDIVKSSDLVGGLSWKEIIVDVKGGTFLPVYIAGIITPNEKLSLEEDSYLDINIYSKYHKEQAFKRKIKLGYDCHYKLDYSGKDAGPGNIHGESGDDVTVKVQVIKWKDKDFLQVMVKSGKSIKRFFLSPEKGRVSIDVSGGNAEEGGSPGAPGNVTFIFSPRSIIYKNLFTAVADCGDDDSNTLVSIVARPDIIVNGRIKYIKKDLPESLW